MRLLLTNDDGIDAPGLQALADALSDHEVIVVAPRNGMSQVSHRITTHSTIACDEIRPNWFSVDAAPADCTRVALVHLGIRPDWVVSGINAGGNLGHDVYVSGTVAAVREAVFLGGRGVAISQYKRADLDFDWDWSSRSARRVLTDLLQHATNRGEFFNVNLPHLEPSSSDPAIAECGVCTEPLPVAYEAVEGGLRYCGVYANRARTPGSDVEHCLGGSVTISRLRL